MVQDHLQFYVHTQYQSHHTQSVNRGDLRLKDGGGLLHSEILTIRYPIVQKIDQQELAQCLGCYLSNSKKLLVTVQGGIKNFTALESHPYFD